MNSLICGKRNKGFTCRRHWKRISWLLSALLSLLLGVFLLSSLGFLKADQIVPSEHLIGNRASGVAAIRETGFPFSFLVIGDTHNSPVATALIKKGMREGKSSFMIILGDIVSSPDAAHHLFFLKTMTEEIKPSFPVFLTPGNHDIDYISKVKRLDRRVTPEVYESLYGARNFHFIFNDCLFIICGIDEKNQTSYLDYLRETLSKKGTGRRQIFVFMHNPPSLVGAAGSFALPDQEGFLSVLETYRVTTCFFGDYHAYWRGQTRGINVIVSGGGGGRLKRWQPEWGRFHHLMRITVGDSVLSEGIMVLRGEVFRPFRAFRKWVFIHLFPVVKNAHWVFSLLTLLFLFWGVYSVIIALRYCPKETHGEGTNDPEDGGER